MEDKCNEIVEKLKKTGINFVAIDFDLTLISEHTGGRFTGTSAELATKLRPQFLTLVPKIIHSNIFMSIVTFSGQTELIREVIKIGFPDCSSKILIRARDNTWGYMGEPNKDGKQKFISSAAEEISKTLTTESIIKKSTLLIDDDPTNVRIALKQQIRALLFLPETPDRLFDDIKDIQ